MMPNTSKRARAINAELMPGKIYGSVEALELLKKIPKAKFRESVDLAVNLGVDPRKSDQAVRGSIVLPKGSGKTVRIAVFTSAANMDAAKKAGADLVGLEDLAEQVKGGKIEFDILLATPDAMRVVGQLGQILGPRGLMPNPKDGTVTTDVATAVKNAKMGQVRYRIDKAGVIHCRLAKLTSIQRISLRISMPYWVRLKRRNPAPQREITLKRLHYQPPWAPVCRLICRRWKLLRLD